MPAEMFAEGDAIARWKSVAPRPPLLDVSGRDGEHAAAPLTGGKSHPRVRRVRGRMRAAVHPDRPFLLVSTDVLLDRDQFLADGVALLPDSQLQRTTIDICGGVDLTLVLRSFQTQRIPTERPAARRVIHRQSEVIDERRSRDALWLILVVTGAPDAGQVGLAEDGRGSQHRCQEKYTGHHRSTAIQHDRSSR